MNSKIIIGTGKLGRNSEFKNKHKYIDTINYSLDKVRGIHFSPTYGYSFKYLKNIDLNINKNLKKIIKIDFSINSFPEVQLELIRDSFLSNYDIDVQISGDQKNIIHLRDINYKKFDDYLLFLKRKYKINNFYLTPLYYNSKFYEDYSHNSKLNFNWAVHHSLVENEYQKDFLKRQKNKKILSLRSFGERLGYINNWYLTPMSYLKPDEDKINHYKEIKKICSKYNLLEVEARLIYAFYSKHITYKCFSFSNNAQLNLALNIEKTIEYRDVFEKLDSISTKFCNKNRKIYQVNYPPNNYYFVYYNLFDTIKYFNKINKFKNKILIYLILIKFRESISKLFYYSKIKNLIRKKYI